MQDYDRKSYLLIDMTLPADDNIVVPTDDNILVKVYDEIIK